MHRWCRIFLCVLLLLPLNVVSAAAEITPLGVPDPSLLVSAYGGDESFQYDVSWSGGIKIGELFLRIMRKAEGQDDFEIHARVKSSGAFSLIYPVDDTFITRVQGPERLPVRYEVEQKEGFGYRAHRLTVYDQEKGLVRYRKNDGPEREFVVTGKVHNEFSSFFITRVLPFTPGKSLIVSTFADEKRHEVLVTPEKWMQEEETLLGPIGVIAVLPRMTFKGLYDKSGDTVVWFTDDACRIPLRIHSKILIGSLIAELVAYHGTSCGRQWHLKQKMRNNGDGMPEKIMGD